MHDERDPVGAASARLLAAGVPRPERRYALRVLGLLLDHADGGGVVRLRPATLAGEFELEPAEVEAAFLHLRNVGVLIPAPSGWLIDDFGGYDCGGVNAGAALAMMFDLLDGRADDAPVAQEPVAAAPHRPPRRPIRPVLAVVTSVLLLLFASSERPDGDLALRVAGVGRDTAVPTPADSAERRHRTRATLGDADDGAPPDAAAAAPSPAPGPAPMPQRMPAPALPPQGVPSTATGPCPSTAPALEVAAVDVLALPPERLAANVAETTVEDHPGWRVTIRGTAANTTASAVVLESFDVVITTEEGEQVVSVLDEPMLLGAGAIERWEVVTETELFAPPPDADDVEAVLGGWRFVEGCS